MELASSVVEPLVSSAIESLIEGIKTEVKFLSEVGNEVEKSRKLLEAFHKFLQDADRYSRDADKRLCWWVSQIREAVCDLEAAIDEYDLKVAPRKLKNPLKLHTIGSEIKRICERISNLPQIFRTIGINSLASPSVRQAVPRRTWGLPRDPDIVGFEKNIEYLVAQLTKENSEQVVAICGMGGIGKTTLAKEVYNNDEIKSYFECFGWVYVSDQDSPIKKVYEDLLIDLVRPDQHEAKQIRSTTENQIVERLCHILKGKKCLVILDDVWNIELCKGLSGMLLPDETDSKILLTTRIRSVALDSHQRDVLIHELQCLNDNDSWELLKKRANFTLEHDRKKLEDLRGEFLEHCAGLPLALNILGGFLSSEIIDDWEMLRSNIKQWINKGKTEGQEVKSVSMVLGLSYHALPYHLKQCFLFLAHFRKNFGIKVDELCRMWIAEGFISPKGNEDFEDAARSCLDKLVDRYMVDIREIGLTKRPKTCSIHDLTRDFCLLRAQEQENFLQVVDLRNKQKTVASWSSDKIRVHRLSIHFNENISAELLPIIKSGDRYLRSFICFNQIKYPFYGAETLKKLFKRFGLLRILKFENSSVCKVELPKEIGMLVHLRFLSLYNSHVKKLPSSIGKLMSLQSLDLQTRWSMELTEELRKLKKLRHLYLPTMVDESKVKLDLDNLNHLRTLVNISTKFCDLKGLVKLNNLVKLKFYVDENFEEFVLAANFGSFEHLRSLVMISSADHAQDITPFISVCPSILKLRVELPITSLPDLSSSLIKLTLCRTFLDYDPLSNLGELPYLRILVLSSDAFKGTEMVCPNGGFPQLESLSLIKLKQLKTWNVEEGSLLNLCRLNIEDCDGLMEIPDGLKYITALNEMIIKGKSRELKRRIKRGGEDFHKVQHVSFIEYRITSEEYYS